MTKNLLVIAYPGEEICLFSGLMRHFKGEWTIISIINNPVFEETKESLLNAFKKSAKSIGVEVVHQLNFTEMQVNLYSIEKISQELSKYSDYDNVFTYSIVDPDPERQIVSVATAKAFNSIFTQAIGGITAINIKLTLDEFKRTLKILNDNYPARIMRRKKISSFEIKDYEAYQKYNSSDLIKYYYENFRLPIYDFSDSPEILPTLERERESTGDINYSNPWDLKTSKYELERYNLELTALSQVKWSKLFEVGACEGFFTKLMIEKFKNKEIIASEPNKYFYNKLKKLDYKIKTFNIGIEEIKIDCDVLFISSVLYYIVPFPLNILELNVEYIIMSHHKLYHEKVIDPIMRSYEFEVIYEADLLGKIENMWNVLDNKEGTNIKIWKKCK